MTYLLSAGLHVYTVCSTCVHAENDLHFPCLLLKRDKFAYFVDQSGTVSSHGRTHAQHCYFSFFQESKSKRDFCAIDYVLKANLHRPGIIHFDATATSGILVCSKALEPTPAVPALAETKTQSVRRLGILSKGRFVAAMACSRSLPGYKGKYAPGSACPRVTCSTLVKPYLRWLVRLP